MINHILLKLHKFNVCSPDFESYYLLNKLLACLSDHLLCIPQNLASGSHGLPEIMMRSDQTLLSSVILCDVNSEPLSLWSMAGTLKRRKVPMSCNATFYVCLLVRGWSTQNLVKWFWYTMIPLKFWRPIPYISIKSTCLLKVRSLLSIGLTTIPLVMGCILSFWLFFIRDIKSSKAAIETFAYFFWVSFSIWSCPSWLVETGAHLMASNVSSIITN